MPMRAVRALERTMYEMPFEVLLTSMCLITGVPMAFGIIPQPSSLVSELPTWAVRCWGGLLSFGGLMTLVGLTMSHLTTRRRFLEGLYVEAGGLFALGAGSLVFSLGIAAAQGTRATFSILVYLMVSLSCYFRYRSLKRTVHKMRHAIELERKLQNGD